MPHYEVIYEPGSFAINNYADDAEAVSAAEAHHTRALNGEPGGSAGHPAERVVRVLKYDKHPADHNFAQTMDKSLALKAINAAAEKMAVGNEISVTELAAAVRELSSPLVAERAHRHDSSYVAKEVSEVKLPWAVS